MTQHPDKEFDIDDGAAFAKDKLVTSTGVAMTPQQAKEMVRDALIAGGGLKENPEIKKNCVRVNYKPGYHVDIPVYRVTTDAFGDQKTELAGEEWRDSNPREITDWYRKEETKTDCDDGDPQLRRQTRLLKKYCRTNLGDDSPSGLILTVLTAELHTQYNNREDDAFRTLLSNLKRRLEWNNIVYNPAFSEEELTKPADNEKFEKLIERLGDTLKRLEILDKSNCRRSEALKAWKDVFKTDYFDIEIDKAGNEEKRQAAAAIASASYMPKPWGF
jgi:hypothetical protein